MIEKEQQKCLIFRTTETILWDSNQIKSKQNTKNKSDEQIYLVNLLTEPNILIQFLCQSGKNVMNTEPKSYALQKGEKKRRREKRRDVKKNKKKTHRNECFINKIS